jgi:hypothetical protein
LPAEGNYFIRLKEGDIALSAQIINGNNGGDSQRIVVGAVAGGLSGLVVGALITIALIVWAVVQISNGAPAPVSVPGIVEVKIVDDTISAQSKLGVIVPTLVLVIAGSLSGFLIARRSKA